MIRVVRFALWALMGFEVVLVGWLIVEKHHIVAVPILGLAVINAYLLSTMLPRK
jgi:hypothetical protein